MSERQRRLLRSVSIISFAVGEAPLMQDLMEHLVHHREVLRTSLVELCEIAVDDNSPGIEEGLFRLHSLFIVGLWPHPKIPRFEDREP